MKIRGILLVSTVSCCAASHSFASDAIVAVGPEAVEYVRVCDAYGTGYFYIPGTETCLHIGGYVRFDVGFGAGDAFKNNQQEDWGVRTRTKIFLDAKSDTEYGTLLGKITLEANYRPSDVSAGGIGANGSNDLGGSISGGRIDEAYIDVAGLRAGKFVSWWDDDFSGESEIMANVTNTNAIRYQYEADDFYAGVSFEELSGNSPGSTLASRTRSSDFTTFDTESYGNSVGYDGSIGGKYSSFTWAIYAGYDGGNEEGAVTARIAADVGPGKFEAALLWSSGLGKGGNDGNAYFNLGEWSLIAQYALKASEKFSITPTVQYIGNIVTDNDGNWDDGEMWRAGVTFDYKIADNLNAKVAATYVSEGYGNQTVDDRDDADWVEGFIRLQRDF